MSDNLLHKDIQALIARLKRQDLSLGMLEKSLSRLIHDEINLEYLKACGLNFVETSENLITLKNLKTPLKMRFFPLLI